MKIAAVLPCYRSSREAAGVANACLKEVDFVICIDDNCPEQDALIEATLLDAVQHIVPNIVPGVWEDYLPRLQLIQAKPTGANRHSKC